MIVSENIHFERGKSPRQIKDAIFGFRPGILLTESAEKHPDNPYQEILMFMEKYEHPLDPNRDIYCLCLGYMKRIEGNKFFLIPSKKSLDKMLTRSELYRGLNDAEMEIMKNKLEKHPEFLDKIKNDSGGITPILK